MVSRASQVQNVPQIGWPHSMPMTRVSPQKITPISAAESASRSHPIDRFQSHMALAKAVPADKHGWRPTKKK